MQILQEHLNENNRQLEKQYQDMSPRNRAYLTLDPELLVQAVSITNSLIEINGTQNESWASNLQEFQQENLIMPVSQFLPNYGQGAGLRTSYATLLPGGGRIAAYVGPQSDATDQYAASGLLVSTLNAGLARCNTGVGDTVIVLPGHAENVSTADFFSSMLPGTRIIGSWPGNGSLTPTFTWTATASTMLVDTANCYFEGLKFSFTGANTIVSGITVSAAGAVFNGCLFDVGSGASNDVQTPFIIATGGDDCVVMNSKFYASGAANATLKVVSITGAVARPAIIGNRFFCTLTTATAGVIDVSGAATDMEIAYNNIYNAVEDGVGIRIADVVCTGLVHDNTIKGIDAGGTVAQNLKAVSFANAGSSTSLLGCFQNFFTDEAEKSGILSPAIGTT